MSPEEKTLSSEQLQLANFFPYRLSRLNATISGVLAQLYSNRFDLAPHEWKVMAALGENEVMSAKEIAAFSGMDKMQVSRALNGLKQAELVSRKADEEDRRYSRLKLTDAGHLMYLEIVPLVKAREAFLLEALSSEELNAFNEYLDKIASKADSLKKLG